MSAGRHTSRMPASDIELGLLQMQILWILGKKPTHGYMLMKKLSELKRTRITQGTLYPTMQRLMELGLVETVDENRKKIYSLTAKGRKIMKNACEDFCETFHDIFHDFVCNTCGATIKQR